MPSIAVNDAYRIAPEADILYAADGIWWDWHEGVTGFRGERWTCDERAARFHELTHIQCVHEDGISLDPKLLHSGLNSGYQAINLAILFGAKKIVLLGFDMGSNGNKETHFFGQHPPKLRRASPYDHFIKHFNIMALEAEKLGVEIINCSRETRLHCFKAMELSEVL